SHKKGGPPPPGTRWSSVVGNRWLPAVAALWAVLVVSAFAFQTKAPKAAPKKAAPKAAPKTKSSQPTPLKNSPDQAWTESNITVPIVGHATAYGPKAPPSAVILFFSSDRGSDPRATAL